MSAVPHLIAGMFLRQFGAETPASLRIISRRGKLDAVTAQQAFPRSVIVLDDEFARPVNRKEFIANRHERNA
jgi:hypothetical protein